MKHALLALLLTCMSLASTAQTGYPRTHATHKTTHHRGAGAAPRPAAAAAVYVCGGGSSYAYHSSDGCAGLNRCNHGVSAVSVNEAEGMGRRPCKKCH